MSKPKAIITVGISASGKSSFAKEYAKLKPTTIISNRDDMRFSMTGATDWGNYKFRKPIEKTITEFQSLQAHHAYNLGYDFILADTNLNKHYREEWIKTLSTLGFDVIIEEFPITFEEACKRDSLRRNGVGYSVIAKQWQQWLEYIEFYKYVPDTSKPSAIIVDIDGTLAHMQGRGAFEWDKVGEDTIDTVVRSVVNSYHSYTACKVIIMSGRDSVCREATEEWLGARGVGYDMLLMRAKGDNRKDSEVKLELFQQHVAEHYNVLFSIDDRPQMIRLWNDIGVKCFAVGNPYIEF